MPNLTRYRLLQVVEYIQYNPVAAAMVELPEEYAFSAAHPSTAVDIEAWMADDTEAGSLGYVGG